MEAISKRFIIISCVLIFLAAPVAALTVKNVTQKENIPTAEVTPATKKELIAAIKQLNNEGIASQQFEEIEEIASIKQMNKWWYVTTVNVAPTAGGYNPGPQGMLFAKFTNKKDGLRIITNPGEALPFYNISGNTGVPYEVIDELNGINNSND